MTAASTAGQPYPARTEKLPRHLDQVDAAWLTRTLQNKYPGIVVEAMKVVEVRNGHTTKMRAELELNEVGREAGIPKQVCLKSNWSEGFDSGDICELEARFYFYIRDALGVPAPACYYADWDADGSGQGVVMMEDLVSLGGIFGHSTQHIGIDGVARGLEGLAVLHGNWWGSPELDRHTWLQTSMVAQVDIGQLEFLWRFIELNLDKPAYDRLAPQWMKEDRQRFAQLFNKLIAYEQAQTGPRGVVHGDAHLGNSYLRPDGNRIWIDWQLVRKGRPWRDVTYFMLGSLTIDERRQSERDLLRHYREHLVATGAKDVLNLDQIWEEYRRWPAYGMQSWASNQDEWGQIGLPMVERFFAAAEDLDTYKLLMGS
jgi:hypothetical protein